MKKDQKIILISIICVIIIITIIFILIYKFGYRINTNDDIKEVENAYLYDQENPAQITNGKTPTKTNVTNIYYTVDECIKAYLEEVELNDAEVVIAYLNEDYITQNNINEQNLFNIIEKYNNYSAYRTTEMYELSGMQYTSYYVEGKIGEQNIYFEVGIDTSNSTFDIKPITQEIYTEEINTVAYTEESKEKTIPKKVYNIVTYKSLSDEDTARLYFADYINLMLTEPEYAYNMLDEDYRNARFGSMDNFNDYINRNREKLDLTYKVETLESTDFASFSEYYNFKQENSDLGVKEYSETKYENYTQYVCSDIDENYYVFNVYYPGDYAAMLDSYTIDLPQFVEKYNSERNENKVAMNIGKIKNAINTQDYKYVYDKLDDTFKNNYYPTQESFEAFIKNNLFERNTFVYSDLEENNGLYIFTIKINDASGESTQIKNLNIVMQLNEGTDFTMSFSM